MRAVTRHAAARQTISFVILRIVKLSSTKRADRKAAAFLPEPKI
jgi:hypothetical protein